MHKRRDEGVWAVLLIEFGCEKMIEEKKKDKLPNGMEWKEYCVFLYSSVKEM